MKTERVDSAFGELLEKATPEMEAGWEARAREALARMRRAREPGMGSRLRWVPTALGLGLVMAALAFVPYSATGPSPGMQTALAAQQAMAAEALGEVPGEGTGRQAKRENLPEGLRSYAERAPQFVREQYPDDPEMLMAAGLLTTNYDTGVALMKEALEKDGGGAAWAAYAGLLAARLPDYQRLGLWVVDPADPEAVARVEGIISKQPAPRKLAAAEVAEIMEVARHWAKEEPDNGMPLALETYYLYGLHRDQEALERWEEAASRPEAESHRQEFQWAARRLLIEMGERELDAIQFSWWSVRLENIEVMSSAPSHCARIGGYEGRLARLEDRPDDAIRWWMATVQFGRHMQQSADTLMQCLIASVIEEIGGSPVWTWQPDGMSGIPDDPLQGERLFHGEHHDFFVSQAGEQAAEEVRDSMVRAKVRAQLAKDYRRRLRADPFIRSAMLLGLSALFVGLLVVFLLVFVGISIRARKQADEATDLPPGPRLIIVFLALLPATAGGVLYWTQLSIRQSQPWLLMVFFGGFALTPLAALLLPLIAARSTRQPPARLATAWRGNLRKVLPLAILLCATLSLALGIAGRRAEAEWARNWPTETEMERVVEAIGPRWTNPTIPPDAWRNEPPPEAKGG